MTDADEQGAGALQTGALLRRGSLDRLLPEVQKPAYNRDAVGVGIVHLGLGAFHRAHQAVYTDDALASAGGDWRIVGISLRSTDMVDALCAQQGLYTLLVRDEHGTRARLIGSLADAIAAARDPVAARQALERPQTRIVSLTITEKAYGIDRLTGCVMPNHEAIAHDLAHPDEPTGAVGMIVHALRARRRAGVAPFTVLCCDNLPENGHLLRAGVVDYARHIDVDLAQWIADEVAFPSTMVDRITPAADAGTLREAQALTGLADAAAIETEGFTQWVIEDTFPSGRPAWHVAGAVMVNDVAPYERMKLRMLNGAHSLLAYTGNALGYRYVRDAMQDAALVSLLQLHMAQAAATLAPLAQVDFAQYAQELLARFRNPAIAHALRQIAMDGTEKLPQRILAPAVDLMRVGGDIGVFAFAVAMWMRHCLGVNEAGECYELNDPRAQEIVAAVDGNTRDASDLADALFALPGLFPDVLLQAASWRSQVKAQLEVMLTSGTRAAIATLVAA